MFAALTLKAAVAAAVATAATAPPPPASQRPVPKAVIEMTTTMVIPGFSKVEAAAKAQDRAWASFCRRRESADPAALKAAYSDLADAWAGIEYIRMGPEENDLRAERFNYWFDRENATGKALNAMLAATDAKALTSEGLKSGSVAGQGMPVIERLLYSKDAIDQLRAPGADGERRCAIGQAVAGSLSRMSSEILAGWTAPDGTAAAIAANGRYGVTFRDGEEAARVMLTDVVGGIDVLRDSKVALVFHDEANPAAPLLAEDARSGRGMRDIMINLAMLRQAVDIYTASATPEQKKPIVDGFNDIEAKLKAVAEIQARTPPHAPERTAALKDALASLGNMVQLALTTIPGAAGIPLGFNSLDGD